MADIPYQEAQVNLYINKIWCVISYHFFSSRFQYFAPLAVSLDSLASSFSKVVDATIDEKYPLEYNQQIQRNFSIFTMTNGTVNISTIPFYYNEAVSNYINSGRRI